MFASLCPGRSILLTTALIAVACGSSKGTALTSHQNQADAAVGSGGRATGSGGAGGSTASGAAGTGGDPSVCHASSLSTAPLQCSQDFPHAMMKYKATCKMDGGYQASCEAYDAIVYTNATTNVICYYDRATGNLIAARGTTPGAGAENTCVVFDTSFAEPADGSCAPADGTTCNP